VHYAIPHSISAYLAKMMLPTRGLPFVTTLHGTDITLVGNDRSYLPITRLGIEKSDAVTAVSEYLRQRTIEEFQIQRPITVIPNFVNCDVYSRASDLSIRQRFARPGETIFIHISNFRPVKRIEDVISVFARVRKSTSAKLLLVGDGPDLPKAEWLAQTQGISEDVLFMGKQSDMAPLLSIADILLLPSENESFGLVALEAMACEVPVIATRVGGIPEVVEHEEDGFLFNLGDVAGMAEACLRLIRSPGLRDEMGKNARKHALHDFCATNIVRHYENLYLQTIEGAARRS
jgi:N-acetyl-alpha-D-glucosaminyl L-malate synthase BshA